MGRRFSLRRRPPAEWAFRLFLGACAGLAGYGAVSHTLAYATRAQAPERAYALAPWDGRIAAMLATQLAGPEASNAERVRADRLARMALSQDPVAVAAVATLGLNAQIRGDAVAARRLFHYAQSLSRRDIRTQLWAIEDAVSRGDVPDALRNYDIALRTSRIAPDVMYPVLASAIDEPSIRAELVRTLAAGPPWANSFIDFTAGRGPDPMATLPLFRALRRANVKISDGAHATLLSALVAKAAIGEAWSYYEMLHPGVDRRRSRDPRFENESDSPLAFDWMPAADAGISASIQRGPEGGLFDFAAAASVGGPLLRQLQVLPQGSYILEGNSSGIDQPSASQPYWVLNCLDGRELGRVVMPNSTQANGVFAGRFIVPGECSVQTLSLVAPPSELAAGTVGQVTRVQLRPAS